MQSLVCSLTHLQAILDIHLFPGPFRSMLLVPAGLGDPLHSLPQTLSLCPRVPERWRSQQPYIWQHEAPAGVPRQTGL